MTAILRKAMILGAMIFAAAPALAQTYPDHPVKVEVGYVPGPTGPDFSARVVAPKLAELLGQPFVVENKPGASGTIATTFVTNAPADGYTLLLGESAQLEIAPFLFKNLPYNTLKNLTPIGLMTDAAGLVIVSNAKTTQIKDSPSLSEIIPGYGVESQLGLLAPAGLPKPILDKLSATLRTALEDPDLRTRLSVEGTRSIKWLSPEDYGKLIAANQKMFQRAISIARIEPE